jgi:hypothetical protein
MTLKVYIFGLTMITLLAVGGQAYARHVTHQVTPETIEKQPFVFVVQVKDVLIKKNDSDETAKWKKFEITVKQKAAHPAPVVTATGHAMVLPTAGNKATFPTVNRVEGNGVQTYTFRVAPYDVDRASFTFTETPQDPMVAFPSPGDYWLFNLGDLVGKK